MKLKGVAVATGVNLLLLASMSPGFADDDGPNVSYTTSSGYTVEKGQTSSSSSGDSYDTGSNDAGPSAQSQESEVPRYRQSSSAAQVEDEPPARAQQEVVLPPLTTGDIGGDVDIRTINRNVGNVTSRTRDVASRNANVVDNDVLSNNDIELLSDNVIILDALNQDNDSFHCINASCNHLNDHSIDVRDSFNIERSFNGNVGSFNRGITTFDLDRDRHRRIDLVRDRDARGAGRALPKTGLLGHAAALLTAAIFSIVLGMSFQYAGWRRSSGLQPYFDALRSLAGLAPTRGPELLPLEGLGGNLASWPFHVRRQFGSVLATTAAFSARLEERAAAGAGTVAAQVTALTAAVREITAPALGRGLALGAGYDGRGVSFAGLRAVKSRARFVKRVARRRLAACAEFSGYCAWVMGRLGRQIVRSFRTGPSPVRSTGRHSRSRALGARRAVVLRAAVLVGSLMLAFISFAG